MKPVKIVSTIQFKDHCLALLEEVHHTRQPLLVTRRGRPLVTIAPCVAHERSGSNPLRGSIAYQGDLVTPIDELLSAASE